MSNDILIIGCGSIGGLKEDKYDRPNGKNILTLAHAFYNNSNTNKLIFYDKNINKAKQAAIKWNGFYCTNLKFAITDFFPEIIVIAVNTKYHEEVLWEIYKLLNECILNTKTNNSYKPQLMIVEKPFTTNYEEALNISINFESINVPIMIDYSRRFDPTIQKLQRKIFNRDLDPIYNAVLTYTRGFKRDASHGIDLFNYLFGKCLGGQLLNKNNSFCDFSKEDPTYAAYLSYEQCPHVFLVPVDGRDYDIFDLTIYAKKSKHVFTDHGKRYMSYLARPELTYGNYDSMSTEPIYTEETSLTSSLSLLTKNAFDFIHKGSKLLCTDRNAINVHEVFKKLGI